MSHGNLEAAASNHSGLIKAWGHSFLGAVHLAFCEHLPLVLSPDDIWLCIAQGFGIHVRSNAEALRSRFVRHCGKVTLRVSRPRSSLGSRDNDWVAVFEEFSDQLATHLGKTRDLLVADFSTTGPIERAASQVVLVSAMQEYFDYAVSFCGIPRISLMGTPDDWRKLRRRTEVLSEFSLDDWTAALLPVLDQFIAAAQGSVDADFWRSFYKMNDRSGGPFVSGWINVLFPYILGGTHELQFLPNGHAFNWAGRASCESGPSTSDFPPSMSGAPVKFEADGDASDGAFLAGFVGISQDPGTHALRPAIGWAVTSVRQSTLDS